ncbi:MAG: hydrogen gas-evolving membrane-bound hydrogenase subunit E [Thermodesulfobacteriota bacterium]|nr:hydrogen gas-evolving membrane-bound hydrogenase subunit E [Thermodesulfobacteriota bacterium]
MKVIALIAVIMTGTLLIYGTGEMPDWGDPNSPANSYVSPRYIQEATEKTATPNIVTAVLADYRGYDTMGETVVVFTAALGCILILRKKRNGEGG